MVPAPHFLYEKHENPHKKFIKNNCSNLCYTEKKAGQTYNHHDSAIGEFDGIADN